MQRAGLIVFVLGVIVSSWYAARPVAIRPTGESGRITAMDRLGAWSELAGLPFAGGALLMVGGIVITRRALAREAASPGGAENVPAASAHDSLRDIEREIADLPDGHPQAQAPELRARLDRILEEMIPAFLEERQRHVASLGTAGHAEMSSAFASAERALARAWSALTDESFDEVQPCLATARESIARAVQLAAHGTS